MNLCLSIVIAVAIGVSIDRKCFNAFVIQSNALVPFSEDRQDANPGGIARSIVQILKDGKTVCLGSIIDSFTVVTAKHCFEDEDGYLNTWDYDFKVVYDSVQRYEQHIETKFRIVSIQDGGFHHHESSKMDVTVLNLTSEMIGAYPFKLDEESKIECDMPVLSYGFADIEEDKRSYMQVVKTAVKTGCDKKWDYLDYMILTQVDNTTSCMKDTGGPLVNPRTAEMVGIVVARNCLPGDVDASLKLSSAIDFIRSNIKEKPACPSCYSMFVDIWNLALEYAAQWYEYIKGKLLHSNSAINAD